MDSISGPLTMSRSKKNMKGTFPYSLQQLRDFKAKHRAKLIELGFDRKIAEKIAEETIAPEIEELETAG